MLEKTAVLQRVWFLDGLDCPNCAAKIERAVDELPEVDSAVLDFVNRKLIVQSHAGIEMAAVLEQTKKIVMRLEPDVTVREAPRYTDDGCGCEHSETDQHSDSCCEHEDSGKEYNHAGVSRAQGRGMAKQRKNGIGETGKLAWLIGGAVLFAIPLLANLTGLPAVLFYLAAYIAVGHDVIIKSVRNILRGQVFDENFLMTIASLGAFFIGEYPEGVAVMLFYQVGELFQGYAVNRSRRSITELMDIRPDYANLKQGPDTVRVSPEAIAVGSAIVVHPGEKVPLDGRVIEGRAMLDTSALTGESVPREVDEGMDVLSGSINKNGVLTLEVTKTFGESTVSKILELTQNASSKKAPTEKFITKFARYYTPAVVLVAALLAVVPPLVLQDGAWAQWLRRALVFLVVSCPCALVISIPLGYFGGIGGASRNGILIKGSNYLEALSSVDTVVFDKTGTLTKGSFRLAQVVAQDPFDGDTLLDFAATAEAYSSHPIAVSIREAYGKTINKDAIKDYEEIWGRGVRAEIGGQVVLAGNGLLMQDYGIATMQNHEAGTVVHVAVDGSYAGYMVIADEVKPDAAEAIRSLKKAGVRRTVMLTGDSRVVGLEAGAQLGLDDVYAELLPDQKVAHLEKIFEEKAAKGHVVFVGDGINDAPALARADVGISMGGVGSDAAIEAADVVIMTDEPSRIAVAIEISRRTQRIVWQNIVFAMVVKVLFMALGVTDIASMGAAVFADVGVALLAVLNAMRAMKKI